MESGSSKAAAKPPPQLQPAIKETKKKLQRQSLEIWNFKKHAQKLIILVPNDFLKSETTKNGVHSFLKIKIGRVMTENAYFGFLMSKGEKCAFL